MIDAYQSKYQLKEATSFLERITGMWNSQDEIKSLTKEVEDYQKWQEETAGYQGQIAVLYVRNLMAFPDIVYAPGAKYTESYDSSLITPHEFTKILEGLYERNYILIDISLFEKDGALADVPGALGQKTGRVVR